MSDDPDIAPENATSEKPTPQVPRAYAPTPIDARQRVLNLRRAGKSWNTITRLTGISRTHVQRIVAQEELATGERTLNTNGAGFLSGYRPGRPFEALCLWYESKFQRLAWTIEQKVHKAGEVKDQLAAAKAAAATYELAFKVMEARTTTESGEGDDDLKKYKKHLDAELERAKQKFATIKRAQTAAERAEPIEMTLEGGASEEEKL